jgi:hypothetical protein
MGWLPAPMGHARHDQPLAQLARGRRRGCCSSGRARPAGLGGSTVRSPGAGGGRRGRSPRTHRGRQLGRRPGRVRRHSQRSASNCARTPNRRWRANWSDGTCRWVPSRGWTTTRAHASPPRAPASPCSPDGVLQWLHRPEDRTPVPSRRNDGVADPPANRARPAPWATPPPARRTGPRSTWAARPNQPRAGPAAHPLSRARRRCTDRTLTPWRSPSSAHPGRTLRPPRPDHLAELPALVRQTAALRIPHDNGVPRGSSSVSGYDNRLEPLGRPWPPHQLPRSNLEWRKGIDVESACRLRSPEWVCSEDSAGRRSPRRPPWHWRQE